MESLKNRPVEISIRPVSASAVWPLRQAVLRPTQSLEEMEWEGDTDVGTVHFGAFAGKQIVGILTMLTVDRDKHRSTTEFQLRGMAAAPDCKGKGIGSALLRAATELAREAGAHSIWFNARLSAATFYSERGFAPFGEEFTVPHAGPHIRMAKLL